MNTQHYEQIGVAMTCRGYDEYLRMFDLSDEQLAGGKVLDVAAGASSFTAEANRRGYEALAVDPRYVRSVQEWTDEAAQEIEDSTAKLDRLKGICDWSYYGDIERHRNGRIESLAQFSGHLNTEEGRPCYKPGLLPNLPFENESFSLVLCSHFLFLYEEQFDFEFHKQSVLELMRVCKPGGEVRIYPLLSLQWKPFSAMDELMGVIIEQGGKPEKRSSYLPFIPGSEHYLRIVV